MNERTLKRRGIYRFCLLAFLIVVLCTGVSFVTVRLFTGDEEWRHDQPHGHDWLKEELGLTEDETAAINQFEQAYREERKALLVTFNGRINDLAEMLRTTDSVSDEVTHAVHRLHEVHGQIQTLSIEHYYDMLSVLPPDKQDKLRDLAVQALSEPE